MKKHHRLLSLAAVLLLALAVSPCTALAADAEETGPEPTPAAVLYPSEERTSEENGVIRLEKVYYLSSRDDNFFPKPSTGG